MGQKLQEQNKVHFTNSTTIPHVSAVNESDIKWLTSPVITKPFVRILYHQYSIMNSLISQFFATRPCDNQYFIIKISETILTEAWT